MEGYKETIILIAEDDDGHAELIKEGLKESGVCNTMIRFSNGEEVWHFLSGTRDGDVRDTSKTYLLLLDINMPKMDGHAVLEHIRKSDEFQRLPVVILTTSKDETDRLKSYDLRANAYIVKPVGFDNLSEAVKTIHLFWELVELPEESDGIG